MEKKDKKKDKTKPSRIAKITSPKPAAKPKTSSAPSGAMATWAKANRKMIEKSGTKKQRAILAQVDKGKTKGVGPVKSGAEYGRSLNKGKSTPLPKSARNTPKSTAKKPVAKAKPAANKPDGSVKATPTRTKFQRDQGALTEQLMTPTQRKEYLKLRGAARR